MEMSKELLEKAKAAKSVEELLMIAKENEVEMAEESAKAYFELIQTRTGNGELADEELDNVSRGGCHQGDGRLVTTIGNTCSLFKCAVCGNVGRSYYTFIPLHECKQTNVTTEASCGICYYMSYEGGLWLCNHPKNKE